MGVSPEALQVLDTPTIIRTTRDAAGVSRCPMATAFDWCLTSLTRKLVLIRWRYLTALQIQVRRSPPWVVDTPCRVLFISPLDLPCGLNSRRIVRAMTQREGSVPPTRPFDFVQVRERILSVQCQTTDLPPVISLKKGTFQKEIMLIPPS